MRCDIFPPREKTGNWGVEHFAFAQLGKNTEPVKPGLETILQEICCHIQEVLTFPRAHLGKHGG